MEGIGTGPLVTSFSVLYEHFGDPGWWPGETAFEVCIGAILTQNTAWSNVEKAISNLRMRGLLDPSALHSADTEVISTSIVPAGYYRQKTAYLKGFCSYLVSSYGGDMGPMGDVATSRLRTELLSLKGIGEETADSMLCYAFGRPVLVVDAYTFRVIGRLFGPDPCIPRPGQKPSYRSMQGLLMGCLRGDNLLYNRFHATIVMLAKDICRRDPLCDRCPLRSICRTGRRNAP